MRDYIQYYLDEDDICTTCGKRGGEHYTVLSKDISYCDPRPERERRNYRYFTYGIPEPTVPVDECL